MVLKNWRLGQSMIRWSPALGEMFSHDEFVQHVAVDQSFPALQEVSLSLHDDLLRLPI